MHKICMPCLIEQRGGKRKRHHQVPATMPEVSLYFKWLGIMMLGVF